MTELASKENERFGEQLVAKSAPELSRQLTDLEITMLARGMLKYLREGFAPELLEKFVEPMLRTRERRLEERIRAIESKALLVDAGIWSVKSDYDLGDVVTHDGSAWICQRWHSHEQPGKSDAWRLWVKKGRDGRDAR